MPSSKAPSKSWSLGPRIRLVSARELYPIHRSLIVRKDIDDWMFHLHFGPQSTEL